MKYIVIGSEEQVALVDYKANVELMQKCCPPWRFSNNDPATGQRFLARWAAGESWNRKRDAEMFRHRCESALAYISGQRGEWMTPTFVTVAISGRIVNAIRRARRMETNTTAQCQAHHMLWRKIEAEIGFALPL